MKLSHNKKPNKKEVFNILLNLKLQDSTIIVDEDLDSLINYFAPSLPKVAKTAEQWVAKACDGKHIKECYNFMYVNNNVAYGMNGHRLHWCDTLLKDGYYDPKTLLPVDCKDEYPDVSRFMLDKSDDLLKADLQTVSEIREKIHCYNLNGHHFQQSYINDALNGLNTIAYNITDNRLWSQCPFGQFVIASVGK